MTLPSIVLGLIISLLLGALFHLWRDGGAGRLVFYLLLSIAGFAAGQFISMWRNWFLFPIGPLNLGLAVPASIVFLGIGNWLSLVEIHRPEGKNDEL